MEFEGKVWKSGKFWLAESLPLDLLTQGTTKDNAVDLLCELIVEMAEYYFSAKDLADFEVVIHHYERGVLGITASDKKLLLALSLRRQREKSQSTVREAADRLGSKSPNSYAQYEKGKTRISFEQYEKLLNAANPEYRCLLRVL